MTMTASDLTAKPSDRFVVVVVDSDGWLSRISKPVAIHRAVALADRVKEHNHSVAIMRANGVLHRFV